ncbi:MAG: hypothetical protein MJZ61_10375 [Bacteroidales bacterium]|nr:hypothetical protein [Bacteroidales bacterium]
MIKKILKIYNDLTIKLFLIPFQNVDRDKFLDRQKNLDDVEDVRKRSKRLAVLCCLATSLFTFLATLPTNLWISLPLAVIDFVQFQFFVFVIQQQLLYIYGYEDLRNGDKIDYNNGMFLLWLQTDVMLGSHDSMKSKVKSGIGFIVRKAIAFLITKSPLRIVIINGMRQLLKWFGVIATHQFLAVSIDMLVCFICALVAAGVSVWQFYPMCKKLRNKLNEKGIEYYAHRWKFHIRKPTKRVVEESS